MRKADEAGFGATIPLHIRFCRNRPDTVGSIVGRSQVMCSDRGLFR